MQSDYVGCLQLAMKPHELESAVEVIELAERIKKIMNPSRMQMPMLVD